MKSVLVAGLTALFVSILVTPLVVRWFRRQGFGQEIRDDGPRTHMVKRGTPTMGGTVIIGATVIGYGAAHLLTAWQPQRGPTASGLLLLLLMIGLGAVGFIDDLIKIRRQRSLGLRARAKFVGQLFVAVLFGVLALQFRNREGLSPASTHLSLVRDLALPLGAVGFIVLAYVIVTATSNAVNLTDGLDGLAAGAAAMVFGAFTLISFFQFRNQCSASFSVEGCYVVRDPIDVALVAAAAMGACFGFLWWNASPAQIFMGDTGSMALGGLIAGLGIIARTELLLVVLGGLFVVVALSGIIQMGYFKATKRPGVPGKRVFRMSPIHHHFEVGGWKEVTIIVRFWIIAGMAVAFGLGLFYADFVSFGLAN